MTALRVNIVNMSLVTAVVGYLVFRGLLKVLPQSRASIVGSAFAAAVISVPVSSLAFVDFYALGGTTDVSLGAVAAAMVGVHILIGIGEAVITALAVGSIVAVRPDLVYGARDITPKLQLRPSTATA